MTSRATPKAVSLGRDRNSPRMLRQCGTRMPSLRHAASSVLPGSSPGMGGRGRDTRAGVMICHVLSCSGCGRRIGRCLSGHIAVDLDKGPGHSVAVPPLCVFGMEFLFMIRFYSHLPAAGFRHWQDPLPRVSRAGAGGRPGPARFARLIARACKAGAGRTSPVCFSGCFSRRREPEDEAAPRGCRFSSPASYSHRQFRKQSRFLNYFLYCEQIALVEPPPVPSYQRHRLRTHVKTAAHIVAPDPDPGPSLGPDGSFSG